MNEKDLARVGLKLIGLFMLVWSFAYVGRQASITIILLVQRAEGNPMWQLAQWGAQAIVYGLVGWALVRKTDLFLNWLLLRDSKDCVGATLNEDGILRVGCILLGLYFTIPAIADIGQAIVKIYQPQQESNFFSRPFNPLPVIVADLIQVLIGAVLVVGASRLAAMWNRFRPLSTIEEQDVTP